MFIDVGCIQQKKYDQNAYGDYFLTKRLPKEERLIGVLSDGLGSGVKANILACMTSVMLLKFMEAHRDIKKACEVVMNSLPVCQVRKISYSTFSAIDCNDDGIVKIVEEGNPKFLWMRNDTIIEPEYTVITSKTFENRHMHVYKLQVELGDRLIFCSDGVTQAGLGCKKLRLGLRRDGLIKIVQEKIKENADVSSRELAHYIVQQALNIEVDRKAKDDISSCVFYFRKPREALIFTGPPYNSENDRVYAKMFNRFKGKKAICGGTTANLISRELNIPIKSEITLESGNLPPISQMEGVDLVTEGILTLTKALEYLESDMRNLPNDSAFKLVNFLLNNDCINFMVGAKLNQAHYDPALPIEIEIRKNIIRKMAKILEDKYVKKTKIQFM